MACAWRTACKIFCPPLSKVYGPFGLSQQIRGFFRSKRKRVVWTVWTDRADRRQARDHHPLHVLQVPAAGRGDPAVRGVRPTITPVCWSLIDEIRTKPR